MNNPDLRDLYAKLSKRINNDDGKVPPGTTITITTTFTTTFTTTITITITITTTGTAAATIITINTTTIIRVIICAT